MDPIKLSNPNRINRKLAALCLSLPLVALPSWGAPIIDDGDDSYRFLAGLVDKGMYDLAAKEGDQFLRKYPSHAKAELARYRLAGALFELGQNKAATEHYALLSKQSDFEYRAEACFRLGQCFLSMERMDEAKAAFLEVSRLEQAYLNGPATFFLAETEFRQGNVEAAEEHYQRFLRDHRDGEYTAGARRGLVWCAWKSERTKETIQRAKAFLEEHGQDAGSDEMRILLGEAYLEADQSKLALARFKEVGSKEFGDARRRGSGFALAAQKKHAEAAGEFALLLRDFPRSRFAAEARLQLGLQALRSGNTQAALRALNLATRDGDPEAYFWLSEAQQKNGDQGAALEALKAALRLKPEQALKARIHGARGDLLNAMGRKQEALAAYSKSGSDYALYAAGVTSLNEGDHGNALRLVDSLLAAHPESKYRLQALLVQGEAHFSAERHQEALASFRKVMQAEPDASQAAQALGRIAWSWYQLGELEQAVQSFKKLTDSYPDQEVSEEGLFMLARVSLEAGANAASKRVGEEYLRRYPEGTHRAEVLFALGQAEDNERALPFFERILRDHAGHALTAAALFELGDRKSKLGQTQQAAAHYRSLIQSQRESELLPDALYGLGWCLYNLEDFAGSAAQLDALAGQRSASSSLRQAGLELAVWAHSKAQNPAGATQAWRAFAALCQDESSSFESLRTVLGAWTEQGKAKQGQSLINEFLREVKDAKVGTQALLESAYLALEAGDLDLAERQLQTANQNGQVHAGVAEASFFVGEARFAKGEHERAASLYRGAVSRPNPMRANAYYKLGFALMQGGQLQPAAKAFGKLVSHHPDSELFGEALFLQGETLFQSNALEEASACFERLRKELPEHQVLPKALFRLGIALGRLERWADCETALTLLARKAPDFQNQSEAELWRGRALAAQRKRRAARQAFERVVSLDKGELAARARLGLGGLLEAEGRADEALSEYLKVAYLYAHSEEVAEALFRAGTCLEAQGSREQAIAQYDEVLGKHPKAKFAAKAKRRLAEMRGS